jgi:hypothetical protein
MWQTEPEFHLKYVEPQASHREYLVCSYSLMWRSLKIRDLDLIERERYIREWQEVQSRFGDYPKGALTEADELVFSLMRTPRYPIADFDQRAADISVDHPKVVDNYRSAHKIALRLGRGEASTEELRTAMIHYRSFFDELVQAQIVGEQRIA